MEWRRMMAATCFMYKEPPTGYDHIPAKGLFPKDRRINLVTVPPSSNWN
jgi:hypothetical protein